MAHLPETSLLVVAFKVSCLHFVLQASGLCSCHRHTAGIVKVQLPACTHLCIIGI